VESNLFEAKAVAEIKAMRYGVTFIYLHDIGNRKGTAPVIGRVVDVQHRIDFLQIAAVRLFVIYLVVDFAVHLRAALEPLKAVM
jgi:hypothetical protein